ncbi:protein of unknown function [Azospirillum baldaniorum]|uniref:Uncharacterized protein n=1 Tax=Azospirillum baldaniorum TaxID=1064539 RepID=A0A9P1JND9_9PROT|nr:protein of unknown function [Azospirillum baldaniorum]
MLLRQTAGVGADGAVGGGHAGLGQSRGRLDHVERGVDAGLDRLGDGAALQFHQVDGVAALAEAGHHHHGRLKLALHQGHPGLLHFSDALGDGVGGLHHRLHLLGAHPDELRVGEVDGVVHRRRHHRGSVADRLGRRHPHLARLDAGPGQIARHRQKALRRFAVAGLASRHSLHLTKGPDRTGRPGRAEKTVTRTPTLHCSIWFRVQSLQGSERAVEVFDDVLGVLQPDGQAEQVRTDVRRRLLLDRQLGVGGGVGVGDQALGVAQVVGDHHHPQVVQGAEGLFLAALQEDRQHGAAAGHLAADEVVLRVAGQTRIEHPLHLRVAFQELRHRQGRRALRRHTQLQRLQPLQQQPGVEGRNGRAGVAQVGVDHVRPVLLVVGQDDAAQTAALAIDVLGRRIDDDVGAHLERALQHRRGEGVVDHHLGPGLVGESADRAQVDDLKPRVAGRLQEDDLGRLGQRLFPLGQVGAVDEDRLDPEAGRQLLDHPIAGDEQRARRHDAVAGAQVRPQGAVHRGHAAGRGVGPGRPLILAQPVLEHRRGRVAEAGIDVAGAVVDEGALRLLRRAVDEAGGLVERLAGLVEGRAADAAMDQTGTRAKPRDVGIAMIGARHGRCVSSVRRRGRPAQQKTPRPIGSRRGRGSDLFSGLFYVARKPVDQITTCLRL